MHLQFTRLITHVLSNSKQAYTNLDGEKSHIVNTAWAMLALMKAGQVFTLSLQLFHMAKFQRASMVLMHSMVNAFLAVEQLNQSTV
jgi:hypothetical protein